MNPAISPLRRFGWLLRRELWEHRIGLVWSPLIAAGVAVVLSGLALMMSTLAIKERHGVGASDTSLSVQVNGINLGELIGQLDAQQLAQLGGGLNLSLLASASWPLVVLAFVTFFYAAGALYDDRKDRSILFWKSLPVSDLATVLSKAVTALLVAPLLAIAASMVSMLGFLGLVCLAVMWLGGDPVSLVLAPASPLAVAGTLIGAVPVYALWALPTIGWLLLCSAVLPRVPFLLALLVPVLSGALLTATGLDSLAGIASGTLWGEGIARLISGTIPGIHLAWQYAADRTDVLSQWMQQPSPMAAWDALAMTTTWVGAVAGAAMIILTVLVRRRSDDR